MKKIVKNVAVVIMMLFLVACQAEKKDPIKDLVSMYTKRAYEIGIESMELTDKYLEGSISKDVYTMKIGVIWEEVNGFKDNDAFNDVERICMKNLDIFIPMMYQCATQGEDVAEPYESIKKTVELLEEENLNDE